MCLAGGSVVGPRKGVENWTRIWAATCVQPLWLDPLRVHFWGPLSDPLFWAFVVKKMEFTDRAESLKSQIKQ